MFRNKACRPALLALFVAVGIAVASPVPIPAKTTPEQTLFQFSTLPALAVGLYQGGVAAGEVRRHGNFGLGTLEALDGELVVLDGKFYQVRADGQVALVPAAARLPFVAVTFFRATKTLKVTAPADYPALQRLIDSELTSTNAVYAIKITGAFNQVKTRSVHRQQQPYPPLRDAVAGQSEFSFEKQQGTMVGFHMPQYMAGLNVPGYHFHFLTQDHQAGGHILGCTLRDGTIEIQELRRFDVRLPRTPEFDSATLTAGSAAIDTAPKSH